MSVITRFAPSPSGYIHLGNIRTAVLNTLLARKYGGRFLLRFEDTDHSRSEQMYIDAIQEDLHWLGLDWDGEPHFQSKNSERHWQALQRLAEQGKAYRCFCDESTLALDRKLQTSQGKPPRYIGRCRHMSAAEGQQRADASEPHVWRLAVHADTGSVCVHDRLRGDIHFAYRDLDDPIMVRTGGQFTFMLPNAIDDAIDGVTDVVRGDDHLSNSAYQVWMLEALGYQPAQYLHHGLLLGDDGRKLSKRTGGFTIRDLRAEGLSPVAILQTVARLGLPNLDAAAAQASNATELAPFIDPSRLSSSSVRWSDDALWQCHAQIVQQWPVETLLSHVQQVLPEANKAFVALLQANMQRREDVLPYRRLLSCDAPLDDAALACLQAAGADFFLAAIEAWQHADADWAQWHKAVRAATSCKGKALFMPLRIALSGVVHGPEMSQIIQFLGAEAVLERLRDAYQRVAS